MRRSAVPGVVLASIALAVGGAGRLEADAAGRLQVGKPHRLKVTHTTRVRVAEGTARLQVTQAKPLERAWPGLKAPYAVEKATFSPAGATEAATRSGSGFTWTWIVKDPAAGEVEYVSTFEMLSADRDLKTSGLEVRWADVAKGAEEAMKGLPPLPKANDALREVVAKIKKLGKDVIDALTAFSRWVNANIAIMHAKHQAAMR